MKDQRSADILSRPQSRHASFDNLMPYRIHSILVVASPYDAFVIEEGGRLTALILNEYVNLNLTDAPRVTRASTPEQALELLQRRRFDLVIAMAQTGSMSGFVLGAKLKEIDPGIPVVLLAFDHAELERLRERGPLSGVDHVFIWHGDARLLVAVIKMIEDRANVDHDTAEAEVRTILLVEDSARFVSLYLPMLYTVLVRQTHRLMDEGINLAQRLLRMRARPKILLARTYEEAVELYERYKPYMLGVITDLNYPKEGRKDGTAGLDMVRRVKADDPTMPLLLQSTNEEAQEWAAELHVHFIHKLSRRLVEDIQSFIEQEFGFGDFVFRLPDGREWGRARDLRELEEKLAVVPDEYLEHHSKHNDFSNWLRARTEFAMAREIRPRQVEEFSSIDDLRDYLRETIHAYRTRKSRGVVADFKAARFDERSEFVRIGQGSLGGKGRGLAFANAMLQRHGGQERFDRVRVAVPPTAVVATDVFDSFLRQNDLLDLAYGGAGDEQIAAGFVEGRFPDPIRSDLASFLAKVDYPLAVRSSSLLEDSLAQPFAGIYHTYMLPNNHPDPQVRLEQLSRAIKLVYASTFSSASKAYIESTPYRMEDEKMAVILQQLVGWTHHQRFYPHVSGVARSYNFYPISPMKAEEGIAVVALGLGRQVVSGKQALRFSPAHPRRIPQFGSVKDTLQNSQKDFYALDLSQPDRLPNVDEAANLLELELADAVADGTAAPLASSYSPENDAIYDGMSRGGIPVLTFAPMLKSRTHPLPQILRFLLDMGSEGMGGPVEIEFAMDLNHEPAQFGFLQIRRLVQGGEPDDVRLSAEQIQRAVIYSNVALGNGKIDALSDILLVHPGHFDATHSQQIASEVGKFNAQLHDEKRSYVLVGPGRWGSSDPWLGIPVSWDQISGARAIVEAALEEYRITPSQGTHFFQNMTALRIAYFTVNPFAGQDRIDWDWLLAQPVQAETRWLRHIRLPRPVRIRIDGRNGHGALLPPSDGEES